MPDRDPLDTTVVDHLLSMMREHGGHILEIKAGLVRVEEKLDNKEERGAADKAIRRHSINPAAHGVVLGISGRQWAKIGGLITALTAAGTAIATVISS